jgi:shikimate kinase
MNSSIAPVSKFLTGLDVNDRANLETVTPSDARAAHASGTAMTRLNRTVALVGMMGAGKSSVGRRLAARLDVPFRDADSEIETAAGCSVSEIFERYGEPAFRDGERRVIARLLAEAPHVLATGGGAFMDVKTREAIRAHAVSIWIKAPVEILLQRVKRRDNRPLLKTGDPRATLERLLKEREPIYAEADLTIESEDGPHSQAVEQIVSVLKQRGALA